MSPPGIAGADPVVAAADDPGIVGGDAQAAIVDEGAGAAFGDVELVHDRVVDHAGDDLVVALERHRDREDRDAVQEVGGAVERIDDPAMGPIGTDDLVALFTEKAVGRACLQQLFADQLFGLAVGLRNVVARSFQ